MTITFQICITNNVLKSPQGEKPFPHPTLEASFQVLQWSYNPRGLRFQSQSGQILYHLKNIDLQANGIPDYCIVNAHYAQKTIFSNSCHQS